MSEKKTAALHNLGCKVNAYETEAMRRLLEENGYEIVDFAPGAQLYIINTCTVTNIADRKSRQMLHKAKKMNPEAIVIAAGCYAQADQEKIRLDPAIDLIIGNNKKKDLIQIIAAYEAGRQPEETVIDINHTDEFEALCLNSSTEHTRAYIKVQDGCNQFCSYCIIPYTRGRIRSRNMDEILSEIQCLTTKGYQEFVLTGIHLSSYGLEGKKTEQPDLLTLIREVHRLEGVKRIRLGSLEPRIITEEFIRVVSGLEKFCPHFHLSLQSGCDTVLARMNRRYNTDEFAEKCQLIRRFFEHPAITTDIIVGFPGETEAEFAATEQFVAKIDFYETHIFKYSRRQGTKAAAMEDQVAEAVKSRRSARLLKLNDENKARFEAYYIGRQIELLCEEKVLTAGGEYYVGYTKDYVKAAVETSAEALENTIVTGCVTGRLETGMLRCKRE